MYRTRHTPGCIGGQAQGGGDPALLIMKRLIVKRSSDRETNCGRGQRFLFRHNSKIALADRRKGACR
eukprot:4467258-Prymnesium_polylepis.1